MLDQITPVLLTYNEEENIGRTLPRLRWAKDIVVVDSGSTDGTLNILTAFPNLRVFKRRFGAHAKQWVERTKSKIACFAGPSFHDGSKPPGVAVRAGAETGRSGPDNAGSSARASRAARDD